MDNHNKSLAGLLLFTGLSSILFIPGVILQTIYSWFPEQALADGEMHLWLLNLQNFKVAILIGVGLSIVSVISFSIFTFLTYKVLPQTMWQTSFGRSLFAIGLPLALVTFTFAFGYTWTLADLKELMPTEPNNTLSQVAATLMKGFLAADDLATSLIGLGIAFTSFEAEKNGYIPAWLKWFGVVAGILVTIVLLRYLVAFFGFAMIGYPMVILWFALAGIFFFRKMRS